MAATVFECFWKECFYKDEQTDCLELLTMMVTTGGNAWIRNHANETPLEYAICCFWDTQWPPYERREKFEF